MIRVIGAFIASIMVAFVFASIFHTQSVLLRLHGLGVDIGPATMLTTLWRDMTGLAGLYAPVIAIALLLGFTIAFFLKRTVTALAPIAYPLAGAAAIAAMLWIMAANFNTTPLAGARGTMGFSLQMLAGGLGGWVFSRLIRQRA